MFCLRPFVRSVDFLHRAPLIHPEAFVHPAALVYGAVTVGKASSIWPGTVLRADLNEIIIGDSSNVQDGTIVHVRGEFAGLQKGMPTVIGNFVTVGHAAKLHACEIGDLCMIGIGAIVLDGARVLTGTILAAGALLPPGKVADGGLWVGSPARRLRDLTDAEFAMLRWNATNYSSLARKWKIASLSLSCGS